MQGIGSPNKLGPPALPSIPVQAAHQKPEWWYDVVEGLPDPKVEDGFIDVWDKPGMGVDLIPEQAKKYLRDEDADLFD